MEVKNCPFCDSSPIYDDWIAACSNTDCPAYFFEGRLKSGINALEKKN